MTERALWQLVREYAQQIGIGELAPHDLAAVSACPWGMGVNLIIDRQ